MKTPTLWEKEGFKSSKERKNKTHKIRRSVKDYLKRKGVEGHEEVITHCIGFVNFLGGNMVRRTFSWGAYYTLTKGLNRVFSYYTKEQLGWEGATVPKENYNDLFE